MRIKLLDIAGIRPAMMAMRLPMKSQGDSAYCEHKGGVLCSHCPHEIDGHCTHTPSLQRGAWAMGPKDFSRSLGLALAGNSDGKHCRQMMVWLEISAPRYFWSEFDTYRAGIEKVSESTMHRLLIDGVDVLSDFEPIGYIPQSWRMAVREINHLKDAYKQAKTSDEKNRLIRQAKAILPEGFLQRRGVMCSYQALRTIYQERHNHRLLEWRQFCQFLETLPYKEFIVQ